MGRHFSVNSAIAALAISISATAAASATEKEQQYAAEIAEAERLGRIIYEYDRAASVATDLLQDRYGKSLDRDARGWIIEPRTEGGERVLFYSKAAEGYAPGYSVDVIDGRAIEASVKRYSTGEPMTATESAIIVARERALHEKPSGCAKNYNTVVIPDESIGYLVYVLAATTDASAVVLGGHLRYDIGPDGANVVGFRKFTNSCIVLSKSAPRGAELVALVISQVVTDYPTEIHVWASLLHGLDIYVATAERTLWKVSGDKIEEVKRDEKTKAIAELLKSADENPVIRASWPAASGLFQPSFPNGAIFRFDEAGAFFEPELPQR